MNRLDRSSEATQVAKRLDDEGEQAECERAVSNLKRAIVSPPAELQREGLTVNPHFDLIAALNAIDFNHKVDAAEGNNRQQSIQREHELQSKLQAANALTDEQRASYRATCEGQGGVYYDGQGTSYCQMDGWGYDMLPTQSGGGGQ